MGPCGLVIGITFTHNITAAWAVDWEFVYIVGPARRRLWGAFGRLGDDFGLAVPPVGSLWGLPWVSLGALGRLWADFGVLSASLGCPRAPFRRSLGPFGSLGRG